MVENTKEEGGLEVWRGRPMSETKGWGCSSSSSRSSVQGATHILVRNNLNAEHVASGLENLLENILRHAGVQTTDIQSSLVGFGSSPAHIATRTGRGHHVARQGRGDGRRNRVRILRNDHGGTWRRGHMGRVGLAVALSVVLLVLSSRGLRGRWQRGGGRSGSVLSHRV
jgi:hypothetical protein